MEKQPSFKERTQRMRKAAIDLALMLTSMKEIGQVVAEEADQMAAAEKRFAERGTTNRASRKKQR